MELNCSINKQRKELDALRDIRAKMNKIMTFKLHRNAFYVTKVSELQKGMWMDVNANSLGIFERKVTHNLPFFYNLMTLKIQTKTCPKQNFAESKVTKRDP